MRVRLALTYLLSLAATPGVVGIDVAQAPLEMAWRPTGERWAVAHDDTGMAALVARLQAVPPLDGA
jgi:hypothetical protein